MRVKSSVPGVGVWSEGQMTEDGCNCMMTKKFPERHAGDDGPSATGTSVGEKPAEWR